MKTFAKILWGAALVCLVSHAWAAGSVTKTATVKGMVCDFCAQAISQAMKRQPGVQDVQLSLDTQTVRLVLAPDSPLRDDARLSALLKEAGYDTVKVETAE